VQGKDLTAIEHLMRDAVALDRAGVACIYLEGIPREVAAMITAEVETPTIGIGAGPDCDGQVLVFHDILNLTFQQPAKFVRRYGDAAALIAHAVQAFRADVMSHQYPSTQSRTTCRRRPRPRWRRFWSGRAQCGGKRASTTESPGPGAAWIFRCQGKIGSEFERAADELKIFEPALLCAPWYTQ